MATATIAAAPPTGLTEAEASRRLAARGPLRKPATSRSYPSIVRANVFTIFNLILAVAGGVTIAFGEWQDALFLGILVLNTAIGIIQEVRAKWALDKLAALVAPTATVVRDDAPREVGVDNVVVGDVLRVQAGDQVVADGRVGTASGLSIDESILTGESRPVARMPGDEVRSGSFVAEGIGEFEVTAVGEESYASKVAGEARSFRHPRSPLERALNNLLLILVGVIVPLGLVLGYALYHRHTRLSDAVPTAVAATVTVVPEGLILLTSLTFAVAALRMARRGALVQQLNALESLASVDLVCTDKTGTLTEPEPKVLESVPAEGVKKDELEWALGRYGASAASRTSTLESIHTAFAAPAERPSAEVAFSSSRRWSSVTLGDDHYVLGAPELFSLNGLTDRAGSEASQGRRVVAIGTTATELGDVKAEQAPPADLHLLGIVIIGERLRQNAKKTVEYLLAQNVELRVLSGDRPETVAAIARDAGVPEKGPPLDGSHLPADPAELAKAVLGTSVIGRISPQGKKAVVEALRAEGRYVAMIGDGVNDVPALKACQLGIAQGSGSQMARSVADLVLVQNDFGSVPDMVVEGRKVLRNLTRVTKLFVTKSAFAVFLVVSIGLTPIAYPLLPRHLSLVASLAVGIPGFFLALAPSAGDFRIKGFLRDIARFAIPAGTAAGLGVLSSYLFVHEVLDKHLKESRTVAATVLLIVGLYLIIALESTTARRGAWIGALCAGLGGVYALILILPSGRHFYALAVPGPLPWLAIVAGSALAICGLVLTDNRFIPGWALHRWANLLDDGSGEQPSA